MGKLENFNNYKFTPVSKRIGDISLRNCHIDPTDEVYPVKDLAHSGEQMFSFFELVKWFPNSYYGRKSDYIKTDNGYTTETSPNSFIHESCFKNPESCYVLAYWEDLNSDELSPDLHFVGSRPMELNDGDEMKSFIELARFGQTEIEKQLYKNKLEQLSSQ